MEKSNFNNIIIPKQYSMILEIFKSLGLKSCEQFTRKEEESLCELMYGSSWEVVYHIHSIMEAVGLVGSPFMLTTVCALHHPKISQILGKGLASRTSSNIDVFEKIFLAPSYSPIIRKFIREHFDLNRKATSLLTSEKIWGLIEFVFKKYDIEMVKDSTIRDESGELILSNVNCVMYSNKFNICCFEIPPFSKESVNEWNNAFFIPMIMFFNNISKKAYANTCISIIKHGNNISIYSGYMDCYLHYGTDYCVDVSNEVGFGEMLGAIIQYSSTIKSTKSKDFLKDRFDRFQINPWKKNLNRLIAEAERVMNIEKRREREVTRSFRSLKI